MPPREQTLLLGPDHGALDRFTRISQGGGRTACALCAGGARSVRLKGERAVPNEDALLVIDDGPLTLLFVADAHYGHEASSELLGRIHAAARSLPRDQADLYELLWDARDPEATGRYTSETTLVAAVVDRERASVRGVSYGDSSLLAIAPGAAARRMHAKTRTYLSPCKPLSFDPRRGAEFRFAVPENTLVLAFTDGVDECNYREPATSIQLEHIADLAAAIADTGELVDALVGLALSGVDGHPGGEDNIAVVLTRV